MVKGRVLASFHPTGTQAMVTVKVKEMCEPAWRTIQSQEGTMVSKTDSGAGMYVQILDLLLGGCSTLGNYLNSLHFSFLICKKGAYYILTYKVMRANVHEPFRTVTGI